MADLVRLEDEAGKIIGYVHFNETLAPSRGITKLKSGSYALIYGDSENRFAKIVSEEEALEAILKAGKEKLLKTQKYRDLKKLKDPEPDQEVKKLVVVKRVKQTTSGVHFIPLSKKEVDLLNVKNGDAVCITLSKADD